MTKRKGTNNGHRKPTIQLHEPNYNGKTFLLYPLCDC